MPYSRPTLLYTSNSGVCFFNSTRIGIQPLIQLWISRSLFNKLTNFASTLALKPVTAVLSIAHSVTAFHTCVLATAAWPLCSCDLLQLFLSVSPLFLPMSTFLWFWVESCTFFVQKSNSKELYFGNNLLLKLSNKLTACNTACTNMRKTKAKHKLNSITTCTSRMKGREVSLQAPVKH